MIDFMLGVVMLCIAASCSNLEHRKQVSEEEQQQMREISK